MRSRIPASCYTSRRVPIEYARHVLGWTDAESSEFDQNTAHPVIDLMDEQRSIHDKGGTMRLGAYDCAIVPGTLAAQCYGTSAVSERHRHRYEYNSRYRAELEKGGLKVSGTNPQRGLVEIVELSDHPYFIACQFHPEFKSRPQNAHPLFDGLIAAALKRKG